MAVLSWGWLTLAPNSKIDFYAWGIGKRQAATFSVIPFPSYVEGIRVPVVRVTLDQDEYFQDNNGTWGKKLVITNKAPFNSVNIHIVAQVESF